MHWGWYFNWSEALEMTASEVMRSPSLSVMGSPVHVAHVGAQNGHLSERPLGTHIYWHAIW
jgi:hypothetical protein